MATVKCIVVFVLLLIPVQPGFADDLSKIVGTWKIVSQEWEDQATGQKQPTMGKNPDGYVVFTPEGTVISLITAEGRKPPKTDQESARLLNSMAAYSGMCRLEEEKLIYKADVAWHLARVGTEQTRFIKIEGNRLYIISDWMPSTFGTGAKGR